MAFVFAVLSRYDPNNRSVYGFLIREAQVKPVAQRHQMVSGSLALLFIGLELPLGSRAVAPIGDEVL